MAPQHQTRDKLLRTAAGLFQRQGYAATGLNQILAASQAPKGVLYFHFPGGKEQLAAEAVALSGGEFGAELAAAISAAADPKAVLAGIGELFASTLEDSDFRDGCPVATVALESATGSEPIRTACQDIYLAWQQGLERYLCARGVAEPQAQALAVLVLSSLQGALLLARIRRDADVVRQVTAQVGDLVSQSIPS